MPYLLLLSLILIACNRHVEPAATNEWENANTVSSAASSVSSVTSSSVPQKTSTLTLKDFTTKLHADMGSDDLVAAFGQPDQDLGSGLHISEYILDDGSTVLIGFAGTSILYARHKTGSGTEELLSNQ